MSVNNSRLTGYDRDRKKRLVDQNHVNNFIQTISNDKNAFDIFKR